MDNKEAIKVIRGNWPPTNRSMLIEALELSIKALEAMDMLKPSYNRQSTPLQTCLVCGKTDTNYIAEGVCRHCHR